jgi:hypothetical protein
MVSIYFSKLFSIRKELVVNASSSNFFLDLDLKVTALTSAPGIL